MTSTTTVRVDELTRRASSPLRTKVTMPKVPFLPTIRPMSPSVAFVYAAKPFSHLKRSFASCVDSCTQITSAVRNTSSKNGAAVRIVVTFQETIRSFPPAAASIANSNGGFDCVPYARW